LKLLRHLLAALAGFFMSIQPFLSVTFIALKVSLLPPDFVLFYSFSNSTLLFYPVFF